jgi:SAM-dependent methyltransferase
MVRCGQCETQFDGNAVTCPACNWSPARSHGFIAWAPAAAAGDTGLSEHSFSLIAQYEHRHFWFRYRNAVITWALRRYFPQMRRFLELGCGTGVVLRAIAEAFPHASLTGSEIATAGLAWAAQQAPTARLVQMDGRRIPYVAEFDVVGAFDVLEHIADDRTVLAQIRQALVPGGGLLVSVPQHQWLWSAVDDYSRHQRRYSRGELAAKLNAAGFVVEHMTSFMTLILPAMLLSRRTKRDAREIDPGAELEIGWAANSVLGALCAVERGVVASGASLPAGGSLLAVARRRD